MIKTYNPDVPVQIDHDFPLHISRRPIRSEKRKHEYLPTWHIPPVFNSINKFQVVLENSKTTENYN